MNSSPKIKRFVGISGTAVLLAAAAVTQATGEMTAPAQSPTNTRADTYLAATQAELADTKYKVSTIRLEHQIDGHDIYSVRGINAWCVLVAGATQDAGHSQSLSCVDPAVSLPGHPLQTGFDLKSGNGYVDLIWKNSETPLQVTTSGVRADVRVGSGVVAAIRTDDSKSGELSWNSPSGTPVTARLLSRVERDARVRGTMATQTNNK